MSERKKGILRSDLTNFTIVHNEFIESTKLTAIEKMVFLSIKRHLNDKSHDAFPSQSTIARYCGVSRYTVIKALKSIEEKGLIKSERRTDPNTGSNRSKLYTMYDFKDLWIDDGEESREDIEKAIDEQQLKRLESRGYRLIKEENPDTASAKTLHQDFANQSTTILNDKSPDKKSQERAERYTKEQINLLFDYEIMVHDYPDKLREIDAVMEIIYDVLNCQKDTIRIGREEKTTMVVISKIIKLSYMEIIYTIDKFGEQTGRIENPKNYILTILYNSREQMTLDIKNQVQHDFYYHDK